MLNDGFTASERTGNARRTAFCDGEERVDGALTRYHRLDGRQFCLIRSCDAHGPLLNERYRLDTAVLLLNFRDCVRHAEVARVYIQYFTAFFGRDHYLMEDGIRLFDRSDNVACLDLVAVFDARLEVPSFFAVKRGFVYTAREV